MKIACPICQDIFISPDDINLTLCGHAFHITCLAQWLENNPTCPSCRARCSHSNLVRIFANAATNESIVENSYLDNNDTTNLKLEICEKNGVIHEMKRKLEIQKNTIESNLAEIQALKTNTSEIQDKFDRKQAIQKLLQEEISRLKFQNKELVLLKKENEDIKKNLNSLEIVKNVIESSTSEVENLLKNHVDSKALATMVISLKRELQASEFKKCDLRNTLRCSQKEATKFQNTIKELKDTISTLESDKAKLVEDIKVFENNQIPEPQKNNEFRSDLKTDQENMSTPPPSSSSFDKDIVDLTGSPYLSIRSCNVRVAPLLRPRMLNKRYKTRQENNSMDDVSTLNNERKAASSKPREELQIFKKPRLMHSKTSTLKILLDKSDK